MSRDGANGQDPQQEFWATGPLIAASRAECFYKPFAGDEMK